MKKLLKASVIAVLLSSSSAMAAEVSVTSAPQPGSTSVVHPQVQKYAQVCLGNRTNRAVLVGTSWIGEARNMAWIAPGEQHIYRFETTGTIPATGMDESVKSLNVAFRPRGLLTQFAVQELALPFSYTQSDECNDMLTYNFVNLASNGVPRVVLVLSPIYYTDGSSNND